MGKSSNEEKLVTSPSMRFSKKNSNKLNTIWCSKHKNTKKKIIEEKREREGEKRQRVVPRCTRQEGTDSAVSPPPSPPGLLLRTFAVHFSKRYSRQTGRLTGRALRFRSLIKCSMKRCPLLVQRGNHMLPCFVLSCLHIEVIDTFYVCVRAKNTNAQYTNMYCIIGRC